MGMFAGTLTALITPFRDDAVDERALRELVEDQIEKGIDGLVPCGTTGESVNLTDAEYAQVVGCVVEQTKRRVPVIAGAGTASTRHSIELCHRAKSLGADGVLIVAPYYNRPTQEGLYGHFTAIAAAAGLPVVLYNIPVRTGVDVTLATLERLTHVREIVAVKEASGGVARSAEIAARFGERFTILSGDDSLTLPVLAVGGHGVISVASNLLPAEVGQIVRLFREGDVVAARGLTQRLQPLFEALFIESSPGPVKAAMAICGRIAPEIRLPMVMPQEASLSRLRAVLQQLGVS
jgi:4-hydroxy-tetrahydrodipicolinate synthase